MPKVDLATLTVRNLTQHEPPTSDSDDETQLANEDTPPLDDKTQLADEEVRPTSDLQLDDETQLDDMKTLPISDLQVGGSISNLSEPLYTQTSECCG